MHLTAAAASSRAIAALAALCATLAARPASAQAIDGGRVVDDSTHTPLAGLRVWLQSARDTVWTRVDSTRTDRNGVFQFTVPRPGIYRVGFVGVNPLFTGAVDTLAADSMSQHEYALPIMRTRDSLVYVALDVDKPAATTPDAKMPYYPVPLRVRGTNGGVAMQFVVDSKGRADMTTVKVLAQTNPAFAEAVLRVLPKMRFFPGMVGGIPVRQVVQQEFFFNVGH